MNTVKKKQEDKKRSAFFQETGLYDRVSEKSDMSKLIRIYNTEIEVQSCGKRLLSFELYEDRLVGKGDEEWVWLFRDCIIPIWIPAEAEAAAACLWFLRRKNSGGVIWPQQIKAEEAAECLRFCGGAVSCAAVNAYVQSLYREVKKAFDKYNRKAVRDTFPDGQEDTAGEYIKINELCSKGILTQKEAHGLKRQLMGV